MRSLRESFGSSKIAAVGSYLVSPRTAIHYTGWLGHSNLGDELLVEATRQCFHPAKVAWIRDFHNGVVKRLIQMHRHKIALLGGGTQIGEISPIERFTNACRRSDSGIVFGTGVTQCLDGPIPAWLEAWGALLRKLDYVGVRGEESVQTLRRVGVDAVALGDPVCWFNDLIGQRPPEAGRVGINVGHSNGHMYGDEEEIQNKLAQLASSLQTTGRQIEFFCVWPEDRLVTHRVASRAGIKDPLIHEHYFDARAFQEQASRMEVFVGIKLHAVALALCAGVPSLMIEYRPKCREFMRTLDMHNWVVRSDELDVDALSDSIDELRTQSSSIKETLRLKTSEIKDRMRLAAQRALIKAGY